MNFEFGTNPYFVREQAFERVASATVPSGVSPTLSPVFSHICRLSTAYLDYPVNPLRGNVNDADNSWLAMRDELSSRVMNDVCRLGWARKQEEFRGRRLVVGRTFFFGPKISLKPTGFDIAIQGWKTPTSRRIMPPNQRQACFPTK